MFKEWVVRALPRLYLYLPSNNTCFKKKKSPVGILPTGKNKNKNTFPGFGVSLLPVMKGKLVGKSFMRKSEINEDHEKLLVWGCD